MEHARFTEAIETHCAALRSAAIEAGPDTEVPTCPKWTVLKLVRHMGRVHSWVVAALANPGGDGVAPGTPPEDFDETLAWWDTQRAALLDGLAAGPDAPAWLPFSGYAQTVGSWARRQAHEAAIHRLDAEHARGGEITRFDPEFAADGIDEFLKLIAVRRGWDDSTARGSVLVHAADVGRVWTVHLEPGAAPAVEPGATVPATMDADATVAGTADAVYRAMWGRPSTAAVSGDRAVLEPLAAP